MGRAFVSHTDAAAALCVGGGIELADPLGISAGSPSGFW